MMVDRVEACTWIWLETVPQRENRTLRDSVDVWYACGDDGACLVCGSGFGTFHVFRGVLELPL